MENQKKGFFENLSEKDRNQLSYFVMAAICVVIALGGFLLTRTLDDIDDETDRYKKALQLIATDGPEWLEKKTSAEQVAVTHKNLTEEMLLANRIKLTSFVAKLAEKEDVKVRSYDEKELPFSNDGDGPIITEHRLTAKISKTKMDHLVNFLDAIEKSKEPVYIQRIDIRKKGKKTNDVKATLIVSTFSKSKEES